MNNHDISCFSFSLRVHLLVVVLTNNVVSPELHAVVERRKTSNVKSKIYAANSKLRKRFVFAAELRRSSSSRCYLTYKLIRRALQWHESYTLLPERT